MANKNFTDFTLKTPTSGDFLVGYNADGSAEYKTTVNRLLSSYATNVALNAASSVLLRTSVYQNASGSFATNTALNYVSSVLLPVSIYNSTSGTFATSTALNAASSVLLRTSIYSAASGNWQSTYSLVNTNSSNWQSSYDYVNQNYENWDGVYTQVLNLSSNWNVDLTPYVTRSFTDSKYLPLSTTNVVYTNLTATNALITNLTATNLTSVQYVGISAVNPAGVKTVYLAARTDGREGTGTELDPYDASTADKLLELKKNRTKLPNNCTIRFHEGVYETYGSRTEEAGWSAEFGQFPDNCNIIGSGMDKTIIKMVGPVDPVSEKYDFNRRYVVVNPGLAILNTTFQTGNRIFTISTSNAAFLADPTGISFEFFAGTKIRIADQFTAGNGPDRSWDGVSYMEGTIVSYNSNTLQLTANITSFVGGVGPYAYLYIQPYIQANGASIIGIVGNNESTIRVSDLTINGNTENFSPAARTKRAMGGIGVKSIRGDIIIERVRATNIFGDGLNLAESFWIYCDGTRNIDYIDCILDNPGPTYLDPKGAYCSGYVGGLYHDPFSYFWSGTSETISTGTKTFALSSFVYRGYPSPAPSQDLNYYFEGVATGKQLKIHRRTPSEWRDPDNYMEGEVTHYDPSNKVLTVNVKNFKGSGTYEFWTITGDSILWGKMVPDDLSNSPTVTMRNCKVLWPQYTDDWNGVGGGGGGFFGTKRNIVEGCLFKNSTYYQDTGWNRNLVLRNNHFTWDKIQKTDPFVSNSSTNLSVSTGAKTLTVSTGLTSLNSGLVKIVEDGNEDANVMLAFITSYNSGNGQLVVNSYQTKGSGTNITNWKVYKRIDKGAIIHVMSNTDNTPAYIVQPYDDAWKNFIIENNVFESHYEDCLLGTFNRPLYFTKVSNTIVRNNQFLTYGAVDSQRYKGDGNIPIGRIGHSTNNLTFKDNVFDTRGYSGQVEQTQNTNGYEAYVQTSLTIGTGTKTLTALGKNFVVNASNPSEIKIYQRGNKQGNYMLGTISGYDDSPTNSINLSANITRFNGSGTYDDWIIESHPVDGMFYENNRDLNDIKLYAFPTQNGITCNADFTDPYLNGIQLKRAWQWVGQSGIPFNRPRTTFAPETIPTLYLGEGVYNLSFGGKVDPGLYNYNSSLEDPQLPVYGINCQVIGTGDPKKTIIKRDTNGSLLFLPEGIQYVTIKNVTLSGMDDTFYYFNENIARKDTVLFENCIFDATQGQLKSFGIVGAATYKNCVFNGNFQRVYPGYAYLFNKSNVLDCTFNDLSGTWLAPASSTIENCKFYSITNNFAIGGRTDTVIKNCSFNFDNTVRVDLIDNAVMENSTIKNGYIRLAATTYAAPVTAFASNVSIETSNQYSITTDDSGQSNRAIVLQNVVSNKPIDTAKLTKITTLNPI